MQQHGRNFRSPPHAGKKTSAASGLMNSKLSALSEDEMFKSDMNPDMMIESIFNTDRAHEISPVNEELASPTDIMNTGINELDEFQS